MKRLLKYEFRKLVFQKTLYIFTAVMVVMSAISLLTTMLLNNLLGDSLGELGELLPFDSSAIFAMLSSLGNASFTMIAGIVIVLFVCSDYNSQVIKNVYSRGHTRTSVCFAKYIVMQVAVTAMFIVLLGISFLLGLVIFGNVGEADGNLLLILLTQWITCLAYSSFVFAGCMLIRKTGASVAIAIVGTTVVTLILSLIDAIVQADFTIASYWIDNILLELTSTGLEPKYIIARLSASIIYTALFACLGWLFIRKRDV